MVVYPPAEIPNPLPRPPTSTLLYTLLGWQPIDYHGIQEAPEETETAEHVSASDTSVAAKPTEVGQRDHGDTCIRGCLQSEHEMQV